MKIFYLLLRVMVGIGVMIAIGVAWGGSKDNKTPEELFEFRKQKAIFTCQYWIKESLFYPDSARFNMRKSNNNLVSNNNDVWIVSVKFNAKSKFGIMDRRSMTCELLRNGDKFNIRSLN